ncbi:UDP-N-acetylmuramoyl-tripeptide--D-alanyl-D-alanine ligase [bacterium]|nr:UDP-N-acetylmuramoyl-tripeptide--D-alanyl-D-alanine ligase [bacterium]
MSLSLAKTGQERESGTIRFFFKRHLVQRLCFLLARLYLRKFRPKIIAITGSAGKTSTKEAIYLALKGSFSVRASAKSYNNEIGVPLTIFGFKSPARSSLGWLILLFRALWRLCFSKKYPKVLVLEMGADKPGDLTYLTRLAKPDISVITRIGPAHYEAFEDMEKLVEEKATLVRVLREDDLAVLNYDDEVVREVGLRAPCKVLYYGFSSEADVFASEIKLRNRELSFWVNSKAGRYRFSLKGAGRHLIYAVLAGFAVGEALGVSGDRLAQRLSKFEPLPGRGKLLKGKNRRLIIDESYNANPLSMETALKFLQEIEWKGRKVAILGDMKELGSLSRKAHQKLGKQAEFCDLVICVGEEILPTYRWLKRKGKKAYYYCSESELRQDLTKLLKPKDLVLVKGSQAVRLERVVEQLISRRYNPKEVLVRQEPEWKK